MITLFILVLGFVILFTSLCMSRTKFDSIIILNCIFSNILGLIFYYGHKGGSLSGFLVVIPLVQIAFLLGSLILGLRYTRLGDKPRSRWR